MRKGFWRAGELVLIVAAIGLAKNVFDPDNGYQAEYRKIWGK